MITKIKVLIFKIIVFDERRIIHSLLELQRISKPFVHKHNRALILSLKTLTSPSCLKLTHTAANVTGWGGWDLQPVSVPTSKIVKLSTYNPYQWETHVSIPLQEIIFRIFRFQINRLLQLFLFELKNKSYHNTTLLTTAVQLVLLVMITAIL